MTVEKIPNHVFSRIVHLANMRALVLVVYRFGGDVISDYPDVTPLAHDVYYYWGGSHAVIKWRIDTS